MKSFLLVLLSLVYASSEAQIRVKLYYTKGWLLTSYDSSVYYREATLDTAYRMFDGVVKDFTKDGKLLMTGNYINRERSGKFVSYYPSGKLESEGMYDEGKRTDIWRFFYEGGGMKYEVKYNKDVESMITAKDSLGKAFIDNGTGTWIETYIEPITRAVMTIKGMLKNRNKEGAWTHTDSDGKIWSEEVYKQGEFVKGYVLADNERIEVATGFTNLVPENKHIRVESFAYTKEATKEDYPFLRKFDAATKAFSDENYPRLEVSAWPTKGMDGFYKEVSTRMKYPPKARRSGIEGTVYVEFVVEKDGSLSNFKVVKGIGGGCDEVAMNAIMESQKKVKWIPGVQSRKKVKQRFTLPLIFKLG